MSARFDWALPFVLQHEGGWVCSPDDPGGATYAGVTLEALRRAGRDLDHDGDIDSDDVALLRQHPEVVADVYAGAYWAPWLDQLAGPRAAAKVFDLRVNIGQERGARMLQQVLVDAGHALDVDGAVGPATLAAAAQEGDGRNVDLLAAKLSGFYWGLVQSQVSRRACAPWNGKPSLGWTVQARQDALNAAAARDLRALVAVRDTMVRTGRRGGLAMFLGGWLARAAWQPPEAPAGL